MSYLKNSTFQDRATASLEAKKALLAKMKVKPIVTAEPGTDRATIKANELAELRAKREIELKSSGVDLLQGKGTLAAGDKLLLNVVWPGQSPLTARGVVK